MAERSPSKRKRKIADPITSISSSGDRVGVETSDNNSIGVTGSSPGTEFQYSTMFPLSPDMLAKETPSAEAPAETPGLSPDDRGKFDALMRTVTPLEMRKRRPQAKKTTPPEQIVTTWQMRAAERTEVPPPASPSPPATVADARAMAHSDNAKALIDLAVAIAAAKSGGKQLGARDLFWAVLVAGERGRGASTAVSWLGEWIDDHGSARVAVVAAEYLGIQGRDGRGGMVLSGHAAAVLARASAIAALTVKRTAYDVRHIVAALTLPDDAGSNSNVRRSARDKLGVDLTAFPAHMIEIIAGSHERSESIRAWRELLASARALPSPDAGPALHAAAVAGMHADRPSQDGDPLGIQADVQAFARLICLEEATPPLSIGLFGEWGSGKSSFMERLQGAIVRLTADEPARRAKVEAERKKARATVPQASAAPAPRFVENVVQIRFNAWHYADANLWASLTAEFFDQLRRGGHAGQRSSDYLALIGKVADRVRSLETTARQADRQLAAAAAAAKKADEALASAREKLAANDLAIASEHLGKTLKEFQKENAASLREVGTRIYRTDLSLDIDGLTAAVAEASSIPGKLALVGRVLAGGGASTWLAVAAVVLIAAAGLGWRASDPASLAVLVQRMIAWGTGSLAALGALWHAVSSVKPVLDGAWRYATAVEAARKQLAADVKKREDEAQTANDALATARGILDEARKPLAQYGDGAAAGAPGTILRYFLFEDSDVRDYDKQVGLVSRARRSFEQLDAIFSAARDGRAAQDKQTNGKTLNETETKALKRYNAMQLDEQGIKIPDRIVLYIDDLDRCTHAQVFDVLQAIHLLLAFELFVVVVGVDVRWVEEAVARQFAPAAIDLPDNATTVEREAVQKRRETEQRKRAIDYLEKIFQLPFWLRRLTTDGGQGGSYGAYVKDLLKANLEVAENAPSLLAPTKPAPVKGLVAARASATADGIAFDSMIVSDDKALAEAEELASIDLALATVRLTQAEVDFLASPELGAIAFKSPRAVKRMLNIYRIVRARLSEPELDAFLGRAEDPPTWPIAAFMAAVETGQPVEVADKIYVELQSAAAESPFTLEFVSRFFQTDVDPDLISVETVLTEGGRIRAMHAAITALLERHRTGSGEQRPPTFAAMLAMARTVRRYSFNRYE